MTGLNSQSISPPDNTNNTTLFSPFGIARSGAAIDLRIIDNWLLFVAALFRSFAALMLSLSLNQQRLYRSAAYALSIFTNHHHHHHHPHYSETSALPSGSSFSSIRDSPVPPPPPLYSIERRPSSSLAGIAPSENSNNTSLLSSPTTTTASQHHNIGGFIHSTSLFSRFRTQSTAASSVGAATVAFGENRRLLDGDDEEALLESDSFDRGGGGGGDLDGDGGGGVINEFDDDLDAQLCSCCCQKNCCRSIWNWFKSIFITWNFGFFFFMCLRVSLLYLSL